jgi:release factor glutamine methyltransferase
MKTLADVFQLSVNYLDQRKIERSKFLVQQLLCHCLHLSKLDLFMQFDKPLLNDELSVVRSSLSRLGRGQPLEQVIGYVDFYGCKIHVTPDVLIPRPETEFLVDRVVSDVGISFAGQAWDLCTGSGCIGISFKKKCPLSAVFVSDISSLALELVQRNADEASVRLEILQGDLLEPFIGRKADLVFCNPPYIPTEQCFNLDRSVREFEPLLALDGGVDGLSFYKRLSLELPLYLNPGAKVYFEIGFDQGDSLIKIFSSSVWVKKNVVKDLAGHDRFFFLEIE